MKRLLFIIIISSFIFIGCSKEDDYIGLITYQAVTSYDTTIFIGTYPFSANKKINLSSGKYEISYSSRYPEIVDCDFNYEKQSLINCVRTEKYAHKLGSEIRKIY